jgi:hypothetical protein
MITKNQMRGRYRRYVVHDDSPPDAIDAAISALIESSAPEVKRPSVTMEEVEAFLKRGMGAIDYVIVFPEDLANFLRSLGVEVVDGGKPEKEG